MTVGARGRVRAGWRRIGPLSAHFSELVSSSTRLAEAAHAERLAYPVPSKRLGSSLVGRANQLSADSVDQRSEYGVLPTIGIERAFGSASAPSFCLGSALCELLVPPWSSASKAALSAAEIWSAGFAEAGFGRGGRAALVDGLGASTAAAGPLADADEGMAATSTGPRCMITPAGTPAV